MHCGTGRWIRELYCTCVSGGGDVPSLVASGVLHCTGDWSLWSRFMYYMASLTTEHAMTTKGIIVRIDSTKFMNWITSMFKSAYKRQVLHRIVHTE